MGCECVIEEYVRRIIHRHCLLPVVTSHEADCRGGGHVIPRRLIISQGSWVRPQAYWMPQKRPSALLSSVRLSDAGQSSEAAAALTFLGSKSWHIDNTQRKLQMLCARCSLPTLHFLDYASAA